MSPEPVRGAGAEMPALGSLGEETVGPASPSVLPDVLCEPTTSGGCVACFDEDLVRPAPQPLACQGSIKCFAGTWQDQTFCSTTGFKREVKCVSSALVNDSNSDPGASEVRQRESYLAFQGCSPETNTFGTVVRFEARPLRDWHTWLHPERSHHDR